MLTLDDHTLMAYVDGELDADTAAEVETALAGDVAAQARIDALRDSAARVRAALNAVVHEPVPERLVAALRAPRRGAAEVIALSAAGRRTRLVRPLMALAASLALLAIGLGGGYYAAGYRAGQTRVAAARNDARDRASQIRAVQEALETRVSGKAVAWRNGFSGNSGSITPIRTFRNKTGQYCREYRQTTSLHGVTETSYAVACRGADKIWLPRYRLTPYNDSMDGV